VCKTITVKLQAVDCTEVSFASFLSGGSTSMAVINLPEKKLAKRTSVHCLNFRAEIHQIFEVFFWKIEDTKKSF
jgi:hypothetical protein